MSFLSPSRPILRSSHWAQLAAVGALVALAGALTIVVATVAEDLGDLLIALACVFVLAFSGWYVLTRRGPMRLLGVPGALLGLAGLIGFVSAHALTLVVLIGVLALFGVGARYAVGQERLKVQAVSRSWRQASPSSWPRR